MTRISRSSRTGFTLIELLVVMAIIATLIGLLMAGVQAARGAAFRLETKTEINKFEEALNAYAATKGAGGRPLPSTVYLCENVQLYTTTYANNAAYQESYRALQTLFGPRVGQIGNNVWTQVGWSGNAPTGKIFVLQGQEALIFWTGGIPTAAGSAPDCLGFNMSNPNPASSPTRLPYTFSALRLQRTTNANASNFLVYQDPFGKPYAYFATHGAQNNYTNDCTSLVGSGFSPYYTAPGTYAKPASFQIVSAGKDGNFGSGGPWSPSAGTSSVGDADNQSNFSKGLMGDGE
jgi:prepilin-type N-terminal cleavage/methylation domain-containing protein